MHRRNHLQILVTIVELTFAWWRFTLYAFVQHCQLEAKLEHWHSIPLLTELGHRSAVVTCTQHKNLLKHFFNV